jgi:hypothetical protein
MGLKAISVKGRDKITKATFALGCIIEFLGLNNFILILFFQFFFKKLFIH